MTRQISSSILRSKASNHAEFECLGRSPGALAMLGSLDSVVVWPAFAYPLLQLAEINMCCSCADLHPLQFDLVSPYSIHDEQCFKLSRDYSNLLNIHPVCATRIRVLPSYMLVE